MKKPTLKTSLNEAPNEDFKQIIKLLRKLHKSQTELHNIFKNKTNETNN